METVAGTVTIIVETKMYSASHMANFAVRTSHALTLFKVFNKSC